MKEEHRDRIINEVEQRILTQYLAHPQMSEQVLFDTIFHERQRLETEKNKDLIRSQAEYYDKLYKKSLLASPKQQKVLLKEITGRFANEVLGNFDPHVYTLSTKVIPPALGLLLNTLSPLRLWETMTGSGKLVDQLIISGATAQLTALSKLGTIVLVPTHLSNLDSILIGYGLHHIGLPPFTYGAGLNLFSNRLISFFMKNLGAYRVDRKKKAPLYKDVLKTYASCTLEMGYHNLFFPGGTRSRSGKIETKLKLGLLGMALNAYINNLMNKKEKPSIYVVPCTLNYQLVLEAETLIDDFLKETGKEQYIIEDDEFSQPKRILEFIKKIFTLHSRIHLVIGEPLDVFGNQIDDQGHSMDLRGRKINPELYVTSDGQPMIDELRDREYTKQLASAISLSYHKNTVLNSTNLVSYSIFQMLKEANPDLDLYRLLRTGGRQESFAMTHFYQRLQQTLALVEKWEKKGLVIRDAPLKKGDPISICNEALAHLNGYHRYPTLIRKGDRLFHHHRNLLLYYQNRVDSIRQSHISEAIFH